MPDHHSFHLRQACRAVRTGGVIAYPTEGVWGLGCDPDNAQAVYRILAIKDRPMHKGLILIGANWQQLRPWLAPITAEQEQQLQASWPGPITWVIPHNGHLPVWLTGGRDTLAVRVSGHPLARQLCQRLGKPLVSTSANRSGRPAITRQRQVRWQLGQELDAILPGQVQTPGQSSRILDLLSGTRLRP